jgi:hypothetical protein
LESIDVDGRIILNGSCRNKIGRFRLVSSVSRVESCSGLLSTFRFHKMRGFSCVAERLLASEEGFFCIKLGI